jgi:hypothetical protein
MNVLEAADQLLAKLVLLESPGDFSLAHLSEG